MDTPSLRRRILIASVALTLIVPWISIITSIVANPWFDLFRDALSDMGTSRSAVPWLYNAGLIISSVPLFLLSASVIACSITKLQVVSGSYLSISAIFLILIGLFPGGTRPHVFVSTYFFVQSFLAMVIIAVDALRRRAIWTGFSLLFIFILGLVGGLIEWVSVALQEVYEILLLDISVVLVAAYLLRQESY